MRDVERLHEDEAARKFHLPADMSQWDGEGKDYSMKDVETFHDAQARAAAGPDVFNGEGPGYGMKDVEAFHDAQAKARGPDASMYNGEGQDYDMKDVERFHEETAKDKMMRRK
ncbi:cold shock [Chlorella sorokiniana]|uniref:Cold shock n=1 Tax=Chlorella sorokiniana TaxID=3076 RepID=A0A2P6TEU9_CHLSO|nr:cold shock [Chlorella sorokiniana]|eukprot:PRW32497.1 cold shock [Chlorella sorokiniana]